MQAKIIDFLSPLFCQTISCKPKSKILPVPLDFFLLNAGTIFTDGSPCFHANAMQGSDKSLKKKNRIIKH